MEKGIPIGITLSYAPRKMFPLILVSAVFTAAYVPATTVKADSLSAADQISVQVCQGLYSRNESTAAYLIWGSNELQWLNFTGGSATTIVTAVDFVQQCLVDFPRVIRFNITSQQELFPNIVCMASVLDAIPLQDDALQNLPAGATVVFDALKTFAGMKEIDATAYVYDNHGNSTTGLAKLNPGWKWDNDIEHQLTPKLIGGPSLYLVDYCVKEKLFLFFLKNGCIKDTKEHALLERMIEDNNPWPRPITVYGYDNTHPFEGGDVYEAETTCKVKAYTTII